MSAQIIDFQQRRRGRDIAELTVEPIIPVELQPHYARMHETGAAFVANPCTETALAAWHAVAAAAQASMDRGMATSADKTFALQKMGAQIDAVIGNAWRSQIVRASSSQGAA